MSNSITVYRYTARTEHGVFRTDSTRDLQYAVVCGGHMASPEDAERRPRAREGRCVGWARDAADAEVMAEGARQGGMLNVITSTVERRALPAKVKGVQYQNRPHEFMPDRRDRCASCGKRFDDGPHEP